MKKISVKLVAFLMVLTLLQSSGIAFAAGIAKEDIMLGVVLLHDENSTYDLNFMNAAREAVKKMGLRDEQLRFYRNRPESSECAEAAEELIDDGFNVIFFDSYGHQFYTDDVVAAHPDIQFVHATGDLAHVKGYKNLANAFAEIFGGRYLAGVVAGLKLNEMKEAGRLKGDVPMIGYVGAFTYAEVVSGYTSFYLGAKSVCPDVRMKVQFTGSWYDEKEEKAAAEAMIASGCDLISGHADSMGAPIACENAGVPNITYNVSTMESCPNTYLVCNKINWEPYFEYLLQQVMDGQPVKTDWVGTFETGSVELIGLNEANVAKGTAETVERIKSELLNGTRRVFDTDADNYITVKGKKLAADWRPAEGTDANFVEGTPIVYDGYFHESQYRSAPYFDAQIDGIELLNTKF